MSVRVKRGELVAGLRRAKGVAGGGRGGLSILKLALLAVEERPDGLRLTISATDLEQAVSVEIGAEGGDGDVFRGLVGPERLLTFLAADPGEEVELEGGSTRLTVKGLARATFPLEEPVDYPEIPAPGDGPEIELTEEIAAAVRRSARFTGDDDRFWRTHVAHLWEEGRQLSVGATDGHALWCEESLGEATEGFWMAVPREIAAGMEACRAVAGEKHLFFLREEEVLSVRRPESQEGTFIRSVLGRVRSGEESVAVDPRLLLAPIRAVASRIGGEAVESALVSWEPREEATRIHAQAATGEAEVIVEGVELPEYKTRYAAQLLAGIEALAEVAGEGEEAAVHEMTEGGKGLVLELPDGKATLLLTRWTG